MWPVMEAKNIERLTQVLETPATTKKEVSSKEHRDTTHSTLHGGAALDPACQERNSDARTCEWGLPASSPLAGAMEP